MNIRFARHFGLLVAALAITAMACSLGIGGGGTDQGDGAGTLGDFVWVDSNGNGIQEPAEAGQPGVTVRLLDQDGGTLAETQTDQDGLYTFADISAGTYQLEFVAPQDMELTLKDVGEDDSVDSDARQSDGRTDPFEFESGDDDTRDAGLIPEPSGPTPVPPTAAPTPTSTPLSLIPNFFLTYEHTAPGSYSEIIVQIENLEPGQEVSGIVVGPAVEGDGTFTATADETGTATARVTIYQFGTYSADVLDLGLSGVVEVTAEDPQ